MPKTIHCLQSSLLLNIHGLKHGFFAPGDAAEQQHNFSFKNGSAEQVFSARQQACRVLSINPKHLTHVYQEHGTQIYTAQPHHRGAGAITGTGQIGGGDAMLTAAADVPLAILIADCLPIFFSTPQAEVIGLAHAGWRGTYENIAAKMVLQFAQEFNAPPRHLHVWIGPGISKTYFNVQEDVMEPFKQRWGSMEGSIDWHAMRIDLKAVNHAQLIQAGVLPERIEISSDCTFADKRYFSYRRDGPGAGHNLAVIQKTSCL